MHTEVIVTDGRIQKRAIWISVASNGVYLGFCRMNKDVHLTYHFDGNVFTNYLGEKPSLTCTLPQLKDLKRWYQLCSIGFSSDLSRLHDTPIYRLKRLDAMVSIDARAYEGDVKCNVFIIEPNRHDLLGNFAEGLPIVIKEAHSFLECVPWVSLALYDNTEPKEAQE